MSLRQACINGNLEQVKKYLNVAKHNELSSLLFDAFTDDVIEELLKAGANPNARRKDGMTILMNCASCNFTNGTSLLLKYGADKELKDPNGNTAMTYTQYKGHKKIIDIINEFKINQ
jgi:ankyrin repeat protein